MNFKTLGNCIVSFNFTAILIIINMKVKVMQQRLFKLTLECFKSIYLSAKEAKEAYVLVLRETNA